MPVALELIWRDSHITKHLSSLAPVFANLSVYFDWYLFFK
jgi:hypothetical protein